MLQFKLKIFNYKMALPFSPLTNTSFFSYRRKLHPSTSEPKKKNSKMSFSWKLLLLLTLLNIRLSSQSSFFSIPRVHARVINRLGPNSSLTVHCQSGDDDLGVHVLLFNEFFEWTFKPNALVFATLFFCKIQWNDKLLSFDAYKEKRDLYDCGKYCYWAVTPKGPCMLKHDGSDDFCYQWPDKKSEEIKEEQGKD